eukprot:m.46563 g.46563  ORF g.46563 m.46563 type:complete len:67 (+) comp10932_c0_seq1:2005-2205(+)
MPIARAKLSMTSKTQAQSKRNAQSSACAGTLRFTCLLMPETICSVVSGILLQLSCQFIRMEQYQPK